MRNYWIALAGIAAVVLAVAALIGLSFARWIRRPLEGLEEAAAEAGAGDLSARAPVPDAPPELRRLALEFNDMVARVDGLVSVQQAFVADASHELRTPLTALRLRLENLERQVGDGGRASLDAASAEVERLSGLVDELLALARADAGTAPAESVDLAAEAAERVETWRPVAGGRGAARARRGRPPHGRASGATASRRCSTTSSRTRSATRPAARPSRSPSCADGHLVELRVADQGPGLTDEQKARAFDRFWRAGSGARRLGARARDRAAPRRGGRRHDRAAGRRRRRARGGGQAAGGLTAGARPRRVPRSRSYTRSRWHER